MADSEKAVSKGPPPQASKIKRNSLEDAFDSDESTWSNSQASDRDGDGGREESTKKDPDKKGLSLVGHQGTVHPASSTPLISPPKTGVTPSATQINSSGMKQPSHASSGGSSAANKSAPPKTTANSDGKREEEVGMSAVKTKPVSSQEEYDEMTSTPQSFFTKRRESFHQTEQPVPVYPDADDDNDNWDDEEEDHVMQPPVKSPKRSAPATKSVDDPIAKSKEKDKVADPDPIVDWSPSGSMSEIIKEQRDNDEDDNNSEVGDIEDMSTIFEHKDKPLTRAVTKQIEFDIQTTPTPEAARADADTSYDGNAGNGNNKIQSTTTTDPKPDSERRTSVFVSPSTLDLFSANPVIPLKDNEQSSSSEADHDKLQKAVDAEGDDAPNDDKDNPSSIKLSRKRFFSRFLSLDSTSKFENPKEHPSLRKTSMPVVSLSTLTPNDTPIKSVGSSVDLEHSHSLVVPSSGDNAVKRGGLLQKLKRHLGVKGKGQKAIKAKSLSPSPDVTPIRTGTMATPMDFNDAGGVQDQIKIYDGDDEDDRKSFNSSNGNSKADMAKRIDELEQDINQLQSVLKEQSQAKEELESTVTEMKGLMSSQEEAISRLSSEKLELVGSTKQLEMDVENYRNQVLDLEAERDQLQTEISECRKTWEALKKEIAVMEQKSMELEEKLELTLLAKDKVSSEMGQLRNKFQEEKVTLEGEVSRLVEELETLQQKHSELYSAMEERIKNNEEVELEQKSAQELQLKLQIQDLNFQQKLGTLESELDSVREQCKDEMKLRMDSERKVKEMAKEHEAILAELEQRLVQRNLEERQSLETLSKDLERYKVMSEGEQRKSENLERCLMEEREEACKKLAGLIDLRKREEGEAQNKMELLERESFRYKMKFDEERELREGIQSRLEESDQKIQEILEDHKEALRREEEFRSQLVVTSKKQSEEQKTARELLQNGMIEAQRLLESEVKEKNSLLEKLVKLEKQDRKRRGELKRSTEKVHELKQELKSEKHLVIKSVDKLEKYRDLAESCKAEAIEASKMGPDMEKVMGAYAELQSQFEAFSQASRREKEELLNENCKLGQDKWRLEREAKKLKDEIQLLEQDASTWKNLSKLKDRLELDLLELKRAINDKYVEKGEVVKLKHLYEGKVEELKCHYDKEVQLRVNEALTQLSRQTRDRNILGKIRDLNETSLRAELTTVSQSMHSEILKLKGVIGEREEQIVSLKKSLDIVNQKYAEESKQKEVLRRRLQIISSPSSQGQHNHERAIIALSEQIKSNSGTGKSAKAKGGSTNFNSNSNIS